MDQAAAAHEKLARERIRRNIKEVTSAAESQLSPIRDHIDFTLQQAYFKCAYQCFDRRKTLGEIRKCSEDCSVPITNAQNRFENEMFKFQESLNRALAMCQDKLDAAKLQKPRAEAVNDLEQCVQRVIDDKVKALPQVVSSLKAALSISN